VLVVVHTVSEILLLKRADHADFWQSVTGALRWGESPEMAAKRELLEETGLDGLSIYDSGISRQYEILEQWRHRYPPNVSRNTEHLFFCSLDYKCDVSLSAAEHTRFQWLPIRQASELVFSWSNKLAIKSLI
jgi:dATP pyrophosphohydrolase